MIRHVYKPSKREGGKRVFDRLYRGRYRLDGEERIREVPLKTPDRQIAEQRLNKIILDEQREREGLLAPKAERDAAKRRYEQHVEDFIETRRSGGRDEKYVKELRKKLLRLGQECSWEYPKDVSALAFEAWRSRQSMVAKTLNEYHTAICGLLNWLEPRIGSNPLRFVQKVESRGSQKRERRAAGAYTVPCCRMNGSAQFSTSGVVPGAGIMKKRESKPHSIAGGVTTRGDKVHAFGCGFLFQMRKPKKAAPASKGAKLESWAIAYALDEEKRDRVVTMAREFKMRPARFLSLLGADELPGQPPKMPDGSIELTVKFANPGIEKKFRAVAAYDGYTLERFIGDQLALAFESFRETCVFHPKTGAVLGERVNA